MNKELESFVMKHTDEQCGLDVAYVNIFEGYGATRIFVGHKKELIVQGQRQSKGMRNEWLSQAEDLIEELKRDPNAGYGGLGLEFELWHTTGTGFEIREKETENE